MSLGRLMAAALTTVAPVSSIPANQARSEADVAKPSDAVAAESTPLVVDAVTVTDASELLTNAGATLDKTEYGDDEFTITASLDADRHVYFEGMSCKGENSEKSCTEFKISSRWNVETAARASKIVRQLNYNWTSAYADGAEIEIWRMDFTYGGVTREHLKLILGEFLQLRQQAERVIWDPPVGDKPKER